MILDLTEEQKRSLADLQTRIASYNRAVPRLRLAIPSPCPFPVAYLSVDLEICTDFHLLARSMEGKEDTSRRIADLLTSFLKTHPLEWEVSGWKNEIVARLVLGEYRYSDPDGKIAKLWCKRYWDHQRSERRKSEIEFSPRRMAASSAAFDLDMLQLISEVPEVFNRSGYKAYVTFAEWLNENWSRLAAKQKGQVLVNLVAMEFRKMHGSLIFTNSELTEICTAYERVESLYPPGAVPASQMVLALVAKKHGVSARLVSQIRSKKARF